MPLTTSCSHSLSASTNASFPRLVENFQSLYGDLVIELPPLSPVKDYPMVNRSKTGSLKPKALNVTATFILP